MATFNGDDNKNDDLTGTDLDDVMNGLGGNDTLTGGAGRDELNGGDGNDYLEAGVNDVMETISGTPKGNNLKGGIGADEMIGLAGNDKLTGGKANDIFVFSTGFDKDTVMDFDAKNAGHDRIDLSGLKSVSNFTDLKQHHLQEKNGDAVIDGGGGDLLTLKDVDVGDLAKGDFIF